MEVRNIPPAIPVGRAWDEQRRNEILNIFSKEVYGEFPKVSSKTQWEIIEKERIQGLGTRKKVEISVVTDKGNFKFPMFLYIPERVEGTVPVALYIENKPRIPNPNFMPKDLSLADIVKLMGDFAEKMLCDMPKPKPCDIEHNIESEYWPVKSLLARGVATVAFYTEDLMADTETDYTDGIIGFFGEGARGEHEWGAIGAWAFGASRVIDVLTEMPELDKNRISVTGHSRGGKTALWCTVNDPRVQCCFANNSGCTGAAISRGKQGEKLTQINTIFPYWFCEKYKKYNDREAELPIDQHMLLSLVAPRPLYLASASEDFWADPDSEFLSAKLASEVYEQLGKKGVGCESIPGPGERIHDGTIGYHVRKGPHALMESDWMQFCDFWLSDK